MDISKVYQCRHYLVRLSEATAIDRKTMLTNALSGQINAIAEVAERVVNGTINPLRRDVHFFERHRYILRSLASRNVSLKWKRFSLKRHHPLVPILLRAVYLLETIADEMKTVREA